MSALSNWRWHNFFLRHQDKLWWLHSVYSLLLGIGFMWLGTKKFAYLRLAIFHIAFIWLSSLLVPFIHRQARLSPSWKRRLRLLINYFQRNFYQQLLFFLLPVYYFSMTWGSANVLFVACLAVTALLATMDIVYDRQVSVRWTLLGVFFAFNLFACFNVMLPILFRLASSRALRISALLAFLGFATYSLTHAALSLRSRLGAAAVAALVLFLLSWLGGPFVPPAPLRLVSVTFGTDFRRDSMAMATIIKQLPERGSLRIFALAHIWAPLGLSDRVAHVWYLNGRQVHASSFLQIQGGRVAGFRVCTSFWLPLLAQRSVLQLRVVTAGGQLIGAAHISVHGSP